MVQKKRSFAGSIKKARRLVENYAGMLGNPDLDKLVSLIRKLDYPTTWGANRTNVQKSIDAIVKKLEEVKTIKKNIKLLPDTKERMKPKTFPAFLVDRVNKDIKVWNAFIPRFYQESFDALISKIASAYDAFYHSFDCPALYLYNIAKRNCPALHLYRLSLVFPLNAGNLLESFNPANVREDHEKIIECRECHGQVKYLQGTDKNQEAGIARKPEWVCQSCGLVHEGDLLLTRKEDLRQFNRFLVSFNKKVSKSLSTYRALCRFPGRRFKRGKKLQEAIEREIEKELEASKNEENEAKKREHEENAKEYTEANELIRSGILNADIEAWNALSKRQLMLLLETIYQFYKIDAFFNGDAFTGSLFTKKERNKVRMAYLDVKYNLNMDWIYNPPESDDEWDQAKAIKSLFVKGSDNHDIYAHLRGWSDDQIKWEKLNAKVDKRDDKALMDILK